MKILNSPTEIFHPTLDANEGTLLQIKRGRQARNAGGVLFVLFKTSHTDTNTNNELHLYCNVHESRT